MTDPNPGQGASGGRVGPDRRRTAGGLAEASPVPPPRPSKPRDARVAGYIPRLLMGPLAEVGGMAQMLVQVAWSAVRHPVGYWRATQEEIYDVLTLCWLPLVLSVVGFGLMTAILALNFVGLLGAANRYGEYFLVENLREFSPWINSMVVAGVVGAAMTADLGARKVREELDALQVLGLEPVRLLVLPRVVAATIITPLLLLVSLGIGIITGLIGELWIGHVPSADYFGILYSNIVPAELWLSLIKSALFGLTIGVVCSYKGINSRGGAIGVGRAVNQAVVISFVAIFIIDFYFTTIELGLVPAEQVTR
jgi:phospholipid/cholesterol/gamma-HCH transport system permease protein